MKNKISKNSKAVLLLAATMLIQLPIRADDPEFPLGKIVGTMFTIGNIIIGEVHLTPAYAIETWYRRERESSSVVTKRVKRDLLGRYFYHTTIQSSTGTSENNDAFYIGSINKLGIMCQYRQPDGTIVKTETIETHTEWVWMDHFEATGLYNPEGPWTVYLKTGGQKVGRCQPRDPVNTYFWVDAQIGKSGGQSVTIGHPNCTLNFPFYLAHDFYR